MNETEHEDEATEPTVTDVPEPDSPTEEELHEEELHEREQGDPEPGPKPEAQTGASAPKSEKEIEKALKSVERAGTSYRNAISRAMGEDANALEPCPRCNAPVAGMIFPVTVAPVDDETREAVLESIGQGVEAGPPLQDAKGVGECPVCLGYGRLKYPTRNPHVTEQQCPKCAGQGYVTTEVPQDNLYNFTPTTTPPNTAGTGGNDYSLPDSWGRPIGHPHYGIAPAQVGA